MRPGAFVVTLTALVVAVYAASPWQLVPSRRAMSLERRSAWKRDVSPTSNVVLHYAECEYSKIFDLALLTLLQRNITRRQPLFPCVHQTTDQFYCSRASITSSSIWYAAM